MTEGLPGVLDQAQAEALFTSLLDGPAGEELALAPLSKGAAETPWRVLAEDGDTLTLGLGEWTEEGPGADGSILTVKKSGDDWTIDSGGDCRLFGPIAREGLSVVEATGYAPGATAYDIAVQTNERQCASGRDPAPYLNDPYVVETAQRVTLYLTSAPVEGYADCQGNPTVTQTVTLDQPLGERQVVDGWVWPAAPLASGAGAPDEPTEPGAPAEAYAAVLDALWQIDTALNEGSVLAVDLSGVRYADHSALEAMLADFAAEHGKTLVLSTREQLIADGLIVGDEPGHFEDGVLYAFEDVSWTPDTLVTDAHKWVSGLGADFGTFRAKLNPATGVWEVTLSNFAIA
jgi:hypothetical protein